MKVSRADQLPALTAMCLQGFAETGEETDVDLYHLNNASRDAGVSGDPGHLLFKLGGDSSFPRNYRVEPQIEDGIAPSDQAWIRYQPSITTNHRFLGVSGSVVISRADAAGGLFGTFQVGLQEEDGYYSGHLDGAVLNLRGDFNGLRFCPEPRDSHCTSFVFAVRHQELPNSGLDQTRPAGIVLHQASVSATIRARRLRAPGPAG